MANRLTDLEVNEGSLVDMPANKRARVMLFKRDSSDGPVESPNSSSSSPETTSRLRSLLAAVGKKLGWSSEDIEQVADEAEVEKAAWTQAEQNNLPDSSFAYIEPGGKKDADGKTVPRSLRHLVYRNADGTVDLPHLRNALARLPQSNLSEEAKAKAKAKLDAAAKEHGVGEAGKDSMKKDMPMMMPMGGSNDDEGEHQPAQTFDQINQEHEMDELLEEFNEAFCAFQESVDSISDDSTVDRVAMLSQSLDQFVTAVKDTFAEFQSGNDMEKAGRKISADRMKQLKDIHSKLHGMITEQDPNYMPGNPDGGDMTDPKEKPMAKAEEPVVVEDVLKSLTPEARQMVEKALADSAVAKAEAEKAQKRAEEAEVIAKAEQEKREKTEIAKRVETDLAFIQGETIMKSAIIWKTEKEIALSKEEAAALYTALKAASTQIKEGNLFKEAGFTPAPDANRSAEGAINARAEELVKAGTVKTKADGIAFVLKSDTKLAQQYKAERRQAA